ncbi:MAG TPA: helix-turn-helix transcriptional regulator [Bacillota bacterium]|nr:helix-turn-helix transcriptional regulator [Bacillota bacterium]HPF42499.1 helix-turn-helix transcriptional regulator [Bacillota bacterium]HPJ85858.1 helix-turn-helix transcriptional regulator [Bacillota bacterium]HPQ62130.1 helix-turn-helix transcriptional regulator [Bacillota bacterium]HRX91680.1 helix-turn-helix transcriptional regulator [Candidatus Izemoplasmatales bacterium]
MILGNNLRRLRFENGEMSQQDLADLVGVSRMTIYSIEKLKYTPSASLALKIANVFKCPFDKVFFFKTKTIGEDE